jgi:predicted  nucleic acid-binding Zn-ribbon protein
MSNTLPTLKEFRRMLVVAKDNPTIASTLNSLRNAWLLCDTEYVSAQSELEDVKNELRKLEEKYKTLKDKHHRLENTIDKLDDEAIRASREIKQTNTVNVSQKAIASNELLNKIKAAYERNKYDCDIEIEEFLDCSDEDKFGK